MGIRPKFVELSLKQIFIKKNKYEFFFIFLLFNLIHFFFILIMLRL